jgi:multiple antibiotic resistance protein
MIDRFYKILGETGINIVTRIMGLILASISFEFIFSGLRTFLSTVPWKIS